MARLLVLIMSVAVFLALPAAAQEKLGIRSGAHAEYSRVVFDWPAPTGFKLENPSATEAVLSFDKPAAIDQSAIKGDNVRGAKIISSDPLKVSITIPEGSRTRAFTTGTRVVLDIYNPPGAPPKRTGEVARAAPPPAPKKEEPKKEEPKQEEVKEQKTAAPEPPAQPAPRAAEPDQSVLRSSVEPEAPKIDPHVITVTSTQSVGVAAFESGGYFWLATDKREYYLKPQINGPDPEIFPDFKEAPIEKGMAHATQLPRGAKARGQGGGLLWRIVVSNAQAKPPAEPIRRYDSAAPDKQRGGTIVFPFREAGAVLDFKDPATGAMLKIVTTETSRDYAGPARDFIDFEILPSPVGLTLRPKVDDLKVTLTREGVEITRPGGLALIAEDKLAQAKKRSVVKPPEPGKAAQAPQLAPRIFSFAEWQMGGRHALNQNENLLLSGLHEKPEGDKYQDLLTLGKMYLANGCGAEALGFLSYAQQDLDGLDTNPDFLALRGVANALAWKSEDAFRDLSIEDLKKFPEVQYWRAYALADLGDWDQAAATLPTDLDALYDYPAELRTPLSLVLAEIALRDGDVKKGEEFLALVEQHKETLKEHQVAGLQYLKGEAQRQSGDAEASEKLWEPLTTGKDDLYRAKAGLALTRLRYEEKEIDIDRAIDSLERLRYAWRGDELEANINYWLGRTYMDKGEYVKGLTVMRDAASYAPDTDLGKRVAVEMTESFTDLFTGPNLKKISPLDAVTLYEQFADLIPPGEKGDAVAQMLVEHLVEADLLGRAGDLLLEQIQKRLTGDTAARAAVRLAAIRLLDRKPDLALDALNRATTSLRELPKEVATPERFNEVTLLRASAYSMAKKPDQALALLKGMKPDRDVNRLRADIAWKAAYWDDAAEALGDVILDEEISLTRPLRDDHAGLILNRAIALNLANDRIALANTREKYADAMAQTTKSRLFDVVTRPRQNAALADRETLTGMVEEVDLFSDFLNAYRGTPAPSN